MASVQIKICISDLLSRHAWQIVPNTRYILQMEAALFVQKPCDVQALQSLSAIASKALLHFSKRRDHFLIGVMFGPRCKMSGNMTLLSRGLSCCVCL